MNYKTFTSAYPLYKEWLYRKKLEDTVTNFKAFKSIMDSANISFITIGGK